MRNRWLVSIAGSLAALGLSATEVRGQVQMPRFLPDVVVQFNALTSRPDPMGFEIGDGPDPSMCRHHQGLIRTEAADGTPYFIVSRSGPPRDFCPEEFVPPASGNPIANLYIVRMGSREKNGERLRSNRLQGDAPTTDTPPDPRDRVVRSISYDGISPGSDWPYYDHPGGMQQVGNIVAVGVTYPNLFFARLFVQFLDVTDPEHPKVTSKFEPTETDTEAGVVALTPCSSGRAAGPCATGHYLLAMSGGSGSTVHFYESNGQDLSRSDLSWNLMYTWHKEELVSGEWHSHQTLQFLRESNLGGALYLAGARGPGRNDPDYIDLYRVILHEGTVQIDQVSKRHLISHPAWEGESAGERIASLAAASTFYVSPSGELLFYAAEHDNDGPEGSNGRGSVKMGEWRHMDMVRPNSPTLAPTVVAGGPYVVNEGSSVLLAAAARPPITKAWIQLFENPDYSDRYVVVDYDDRNNDDFNDFRRLDPGFFFPTAPPDPNGASDEASSWRWLAPVGCSIRANDDDFDDPDEFPGIDTRTLPGTGAPERDPNLLSVSNDAGTGNVDDTLTSVQFFTDCDAYYSASMTTVWDSDLDGTPDTQGASLPFLALEGPAQVGVPVQATHPFDGLTGTGVATVTVLNVAPSIEASGAFDAAGRAIGSDVPFVLRGRPITIRTMFTDPGRQDHQNASVNWGDGGVDHVFGIFNDAFGGVEGRLQHGHVYAAGGVYDITLDVTDDDLGTVRGVMRVIVVSPSQAVESIVDRLDTQIALTTNAKILKLLRQGRKALAGDVTGFREDGALHKLQLDQTAAGLARLRNALMDLQRAQAAGANVATLIGLIEEVIAALS